MLISTNPHLVPGIWSLAPASSMVRLRLRGAATESSCPTCVKPRITQGQQGIPGTAGGRAGIDMERSGITSDRTGIARDRAGIARDRAGMARDRARNSQVQLAYLVKYPNFIQLVKQGPKRRDLNVSALCTGGIFNIPINIHPSHDN